MTSVIRLCLATLLTTLIALAAATPASAHAALVSSDPADGASLPTAPARVSATFNEAMQPAFAAMTVVGPDGGQWADGDVDVQGPTLGVAVRQGGPAGTYTVNYRATSADGHVVSGSWSYTTAESAPAPASPTTSAAPATATPAAAPAPVEDGMPVWPFAVGVSVIIAGGALWAVRRRS
jgi:methionine-rich copper-binding protein CopC